MQPSIGARVFLPVFKARFEAFSTPFRIFSDIQSVGNSLNFNIYFNVGVVFRLVFEVQTFKQCPPYFGPVFKPQNAIPGHVTFRGPTFLMEAKFTSVMHSN